MMLYCGSNQLLSAFVCLLRIFTISCLFYRKLLMFIVLLVDANHLKVYYYAVILCINHTGWEG